MNDTPSTRTDDWTEQAVSAIETAVTTVRDKAVEPAQRATSNVVFGLIVTFFAVPAVILLLIGVFRFVNNYLPGDVWATWLLFGGIFLVGGAFVWTKRRPSSA